MLRNEKYMGDALPVSYTHLSTGTHGDNHGNQPFLHVVFRTGQDARRFQKTHPVKHSDLSDMPEPHGCPVPPGSAPSGKKDPLPGTVDALVLML